jgi:hypothetical protein
MLGRRRKPMGKEQFIGTWKLVSHKYRQSDGRLSYPLGRDAVGIAMLDANGHYSAQITRPALPAFASGDRLKGTPAEIRSAFEGSFAYFGTYEVNQEEHTLTLHVGGSTFPNWVGTAQKRFFEFSGNRVTLTTQPITVGGKQVTGVLTWERAG